MFTIFVIARNTFREAVRDRILYGILLFGALYVLTALFVAKLALGDMLIVRSFGLAGIYLFGLLTTVFLGASLLYREVERRTLYFVLAKPVSHRDVILGMFAGLYAAIICTIVCMTVFYLCVIASLGGGLDGGAFLAIFGEMLEIGLLTALLIFFSAVLPPLLSTISAVMLLFVGHLLSTFLANAATLGPFFRAGAEFFYYLLPNLEKFDFRSLAVHNAAIPPVALCISAAYATLYAAVLLSLAIVSFKKKEL